MLAVTAILSCVIKIRGIFKSTKWRHFENVKFEALSARRELVTRVSDCIKKGNHRISDVSIDQGKWFAAKVLKENTEMRNDESMNSELTFVPTVPASGWRSFPSQDIPSLFNYGHIYYYVLKSIKTVVTHVDTNAHQSDERR